MNNLNPSKRLLHRNNWPIRLFLVHIAYLLAQNVFHIVQTRPLYDFIINLSIAVSLFLVSLRNIKFRRYYIDSGFLLCHHLFFIYALIIWTFSVINAEFIETRLKMISQLGGWLLVYSVYAFNVKDFFFSFINVLLKIWMPLFIILLLLRYLEYVKFDSQESYLLLFVFLLLPFLNNSKRFLSYIGMTLLIYASLDARAMIILIIVSMIIFALYKMKFPRMVYVITANCLLFIPILFLLFGVLGNINMISFLSNETNETDTRSFLYLEVEQHIEKHEAYLLGTPGIGYNSSLKDVVHKNMETGEMEYYYEDLKYGRMGSEVGMLNLYQHGGLVFCFLLFMLYFYTVNMTLIFSRNDYCRYIALLLSFRFSFMFIDGLITAFWQSLVLWMLFSICTNKSLLMMSDREITKYFKLSKLKIRELL